MLAGVDRALDVGAHRLVTAGDLHHDLDGRVLEDLRRVGGQEVWRDLDRPAFGDVPHQHLLQAELDAGPPRELRAPGQHPLGDLRADGAEADQADVQGTRCHRGLFSLPWR